MQPLGQDPPDEVIRAQPGEFQGERKHGHHIGTEACEQVGPPSEDVRSGG